MNRFYLPKNINHVADMWSYSWSDIGKRDSGFCREMLFLLVNVKYD